MIRLQAINPLVIDYFLGQNKHLQSIGRLLIGSALLDAESKGRPLGADKHEKHDWYRFLLYKLCENCAKSGEATEAESAFVKWNRIYLRSTQIRVIDDDKPRCLAI